MPAFGGPLSLQFHLLAQANLTLRILQVPDAADMQLNPRAQAFKDLFQLFLIVT